MNHIGMNYEKRGCRDNPRVIIGLGPQESDSYLEIGMQEVYWKVLSGLTPVGRKGRKLDCDEVSTKARLMGWGGGWPLKLGGPHKSSPELGQGIQTPFGLHHPATGCR